MESTLERAFSVEGELPIGEWVSGQGKSVPSTAPVGADDTGQKRRALARKVKSDSERKGVPAKATKVKSYSGEKGVPAKATRVKSDSEEKGVPAKATRVKSYSEEEGVSVKKSRTPTRKPPQRPDMSATSSEAEIKGVQNSRTPTRKPPQRPDRSEKKAGPTKPERPPPKKPESSAVEQVEVTEAGVAAEPSSEPETETTISLGQRIILAMDASDSDKTEVCGEMEKISTTVPAIRIFQTIPSIYLKPTYAPRYIEPINTISTNIGILHASGAITEDEKNSILKKLDEYLKRKIAEEKQQTQRARGGGRKQLKSKKRKSKKRKSKKRKSKKRKSKKYTRRKK